MCKRTSRNSTNWWWRKRKKIFQLFVFFSFFLRSCTVKISQKLSLLSKSRHGESIQNNKIDRNFLDFETLGNFNISPTQFHFTGDNNGSKTSARLTLSLEHMKINWIAKLPHELVASTSAERRKRLNFTWTFCVSFHLWERAEHSKIFSIFRCFDLVYTVFLHLTSFSLRCLGIQWIQRVK